MKNNYIYIITSLLVVFCFSRCKEDLGQYNYQEISEFRIDTIGNGGPFTVRQHIQELIISPKVIYGGNKTLDYYWIFGDTSNDTLSREKELKKTVNLDITPSAHRLVFQVVERETGRMVATQYNVYVTGATGLGLIVAHEKEGTADIDLVYLAEGSDAILRNIHQTMNASRLPGSVTGLGTIGENNLYMFMTDQTISLLSADGMVKQFEDEEIFGQLNPPTFKPQAFAFMAGNVNFFVNDGQVYQNFVGGTATPGFMTQKVEMADGSPYRVTPNIILTTSKGGAFYDEIGKRMIQMGGNTSNTFPVPIKATNANAQFSFDHIDRKLLFARKGFQLYNANFLEILSNSTVYAFFADQSGNGRYVYVMGMETPAKPSFALLDVTTAPEIQQASFYEVSETTPAVYYGDNKKIHVLNIDINRENSEDSFYLHRGVQFTTPTGEEISCVKLERFGAFGTWYFYIATYNATTEESKVYQYGVASGTGQLSSTPVQTWTGFGGRVSKMELKRY